MEPTVIKKAKQFMSFNFGDIQLLEIMNFLGGATSLDSFLRTYETSEPKGFFPYEQFDCPQKKNNSQLPPYDAICIFQQTSKREPPGKGPFRLSKIT